ncbi:SdiA-regulated domain-containing protein [Bdellovibrio sp. HCB337]|uniref:SdiA-regulated domain-containing protein n=1 Tax=Bdellovibrio sp. HCB337 TaxID=3394358 RepID=UPI0039A67C10
MKVLITGLATACLMAAIPAFAVNEAASVLADYSKVDEVIPLPDVGGNLSGITYNYDTGTYFLVQNNYGKLFEYDRSFKKPLRIINMINLKDDDTEDIVYLGQGRYAVSTEDNYIFIFSIAPKQTTVDMSPSRVDVQQFTLPSPRKDNKGLEGVCFTRNSKDGRGVFFAVQEQKPKRIFAFNWPNSNDDFKRNFGLTEPFDTEAIMKHRLSDLSGCTFDDSTNHLLVLSHESSRLMELGRTGHIVNTLDIPAVASQYEGVTFGANRELMLVSEPSTLVIMKKRQ